MRRLLPLTVLLGLAALPACASGASTTAAAEVIPPRTAESPAALDPQPGETFRVGGDTQAAVERYSKGFRFDNGTMRINTPLPVGYPDPTPPGAIDLKAYPAVRRAEVSSEGRVSLNGAFWPLFRHIQRRDIAMTSPVEMDYPGLTSAPGDQPDSWTMSFLYYTPDLGPTGEDGQRVVVRDAAPVTVVALGLRGVYDLEAARQGIATLEAWLASNPQWVRDGEPRTLGYNGPDIARRNRWGEVQIPVRRADLAAAPQAAEPAAPATKDPAPADSAGQ